MNKLKEEVELWRDAAGMRAFVLHGRLNIQFKGVTLRVSPFEPRPKLPAGIEFQLREDGRITIQPEVSNVVVLRKEPHT